MSIAKGIKEFRSLVASDSLTKETKLSWSFQKMLAAKIRAHVAKAPQYPLDCSSVALRRHQSEHVARNGVGAA